MISRFFVGIAAIGVMAFARVHSAAGGIDFRRESAPLSWIEQQLPEALPPVVTPAYFTVLEQAKAQAFHGRYKQALLTLRKVKPDADPVALALVKSTALAATGQRDAAIEALSTGPVQGDPAARILRARILAEQGKLPDAIEAFRRVASDHPDSIPAHFWLADALDSAGDPAGALAAYAWFDAQPQRFMDRWRADVGGLFGRAEDVVLIARAYDRWASMTSAYRDNRRLHDDILGMFVKAYDMIDREYYPAHVAAAEYFLSHDNPIEAIKELKAAKASNPNDARTIVLLGQIALMQFNFDGADTAVEQLRQVDPDSLDADLLEVRNLLLQRKPKDAEAPLATILAKVPDHRVALGLLAATYALQLRDADLESALARVDRFAPRSPEAYFEVAEQLGAMRQYPRAAAMYQRAIERAPWWTAPRNGLGLLYTQSGDEDEAQRVLDAAHALDPFNLRTTNYLRLLDMMAKFARVETDHFVVMYDAVKDPVIPEYFADYLESIYRDVCGEFQHEPARKTLIEVFPTHDAFSVRTTGTPWIGTVGASTGRVIALVSPRKGAQTMGTFNWAQVLRHEFTHTVTLSATDNRIAHWMTEGLAVVQEHSPIRWEWVPMLYSAVKQKKLFTMDGLTWGFVRPKRPIDRQLAYAQSFWICDYIQEKYGQQALLKMMDLFRQGGRQEDVFPQVLGRSLSDFSNDFFAWTEKQVAGWGYDGPTTEKVNGLKQRGEKLIAERRYDQAAEVWEQIATLRPVDALPHARLAGLYLSKTINKPELALKHLIALHQVELKDNRYAKRIARLLRDLHRAGEAEQYAIQAVYVDPYDLDAHKLLKEIHELTGNARGIAREDRVIPILTQWLARKDQPTGGASGGGGG